MRLWSLHPKYLDSKGLVALWREALLAQNVLAGRTKGYKNHPQLERFKNTSNPSGAIATYLRHVFNEAEERGYSFDKDKISNQRSRAKIKVTSGQLKYEYQHLAKKLKTRDAEAFKRLPKASEVEPHPMFRIISGKIEDWEITS